MGFLAQNPMNTSRQAPINAVPVSAAAQNPIGLSPLFGRPGWNYVNVTQTPVKGPQPKLSVGSGRTGDSSLPGNAAALPGYLSDNSYFPSEFEYESVHNPSGRLNIPRSIGVGSDGISMLGTYRAHENVQADRFFTQNRSAPSWQQMAFPPDNRNILAYQQVRKYQLNSLTQQARPLSQNDYFVGYQVNPSIQGAIGQSTLGNLGG